MLIKQELINQQIGLRNMDESTTQEGSSLHTEQIAFKKPILIGRIGKLPKKSQNATENQNNDKTPEEQPSNSEKSEKSSPSALPPAVLLKELSTPIPYKEPKWSGLCPDGSEYALEVLKSGMIVDKVDLTNKSCYVFGRLANCDVVKAHPTISRHHAVLQYKAFSEDGEPPAGWYLFDLGSTHGTYLNKERLKSSHYTRVRVGHQIKFGNSSRTYIMLGPDFDCEGETELSVTEIKRRAEIMKAERGRMIQEAIEQREMNRLEEEKKRQEQGIDWGMGEDAEEEPDLMDNPYAATANEELYLDDPKKTLRGYFEREGYELTYDCEERGVGQFLCRVELPLDDARGRPVVAEVMHKGKKKEAVAACALEACRVLDRAGVLRQARHEPRRRKQRDWGADDYYDSDEDTFLDRTGSVERKRTLRMRRHATGTAGTASTTGTGAPDKALTYDDLLKQISEIEAKICDEEKTLEQLRCSSKPTERADDAGDALDEYMSTLGSQGQSMAHKTEISKTKMNIQKLKAELAKTQRLAEIARPAHLPPLIKRDDKKMAVKVGTNSVVYGKRIRLKEDAERKPKIREQKKQDESEFVEEMDSDEEEVSTEQNVQNSAEEQQDRTAHHSAAVREAEDSTSNKEKKNETRVFGPMRPPENYVVPENYFDQESDRDLPVIEDDGKS